MMTMTRRTWLAQNAAAALTAVVPLSSRRQSRRWPRSTRQPSTPLTAAQAASHAQRRDPAPMLALAQRAVEAAQAAGAHYADARLSRIVQHQYWWGGAAPGDRFSGAREELGVGVRALVNGYWGFAASAVWEPDEVVRLARAAVQQATTNAKGLPRTTDLGRYPVASGTWETPVRLDPFTISIEEKLDNFAYWDACARQAASAPGTPPWHVAPEACVFLFARQERAVATSEGARFAQTCYETGGKIVCKGGANDEVSAELSGIAPVGAGWEHLLDANIPEQFLTMRTTLAERLALRAAARPGTLGRYTLVCDGATMAALTESTLGVATQLDRALGYEANASGSSFLEDPLGMLGTDHVTAPLVTVTANRSAPGQLATTKWDDEGVEPRDVTLIQNGVLMDFQTTREQAAWLAPYYEQHGRPVRSHGYAAVEDALTIPMQHMPNLALQPGAAAVRLEDLIADVQDGILMTNGSVAGIDQQARSGMLLGEMRKIRNGRLGPLLLGGAVLFDALDLWKHVTAIGGPVTRMHNAYTQYSIWSCFGLPGVEFDWQGGGIRIGKGEPMQATSHTVQGVAATITDQAIIDPSRKA